VKTECLRAAEAEEAMARQPRAARTSAMGMPGNEARPDRVSLYTRSFNSLSPSPCPSLWAKSGGDLPRVIATIDDLFSVGKYWFLKMDGRPAGGRQNPG
jgi:hypothetical protein